MVCGIYWTVCSCFVYICISVYIWVCTGGDVKGRLTIDCWLSGFESLSYNGDNDANETARGHLQSLVSDFTYILLIAGDSKAIPRKESLCVCPVSHDFLLKNILLATVRKGILS